MHTPMAVPCVKRAFVLACVCRHATWSKTGSITAGESRGVELALSVEEYRGCIKAWWIFNDFVLFNNEAHVAIMETALYM